ncbi:MAG: dTMP kinase [Pseudomonadota bacterium]
MRGLAEALRGDGLEVQTTREPGGSPGAEEIRRLLVEGEPGRWSPETELLLFNAARRDHLERTIAPALARRAVVLCDRFVDSTRAYQAAGRGLSLDLVDALHAQVIGREADLTLILDLDPAEARARQAAAAGATGAAGLREDRYERLGLDFQTRLRAAFLAIADRDPGRCRVLDAGLGAERVAAAALAEVRGAVAAAAGA